MNRSRHFTPICHESRDLGYAREQRRQRRITWALSALLCVLLWMLYYQMTH